MAESTGYARSRAALIIRCMAACVDLFCLALGAKAIELLAGFGAGQFGLIIAQPVEGIMLAGGALLASTCEILGEASPGKLLCGLRTRSVTGERAPMHRRIVRWSLKTIPLWLALIAAYVEQMATSRGVRSDPLALRFATAATFSAAGLLIAFAPAGSRSRRSIADMIAGTAVFPARPEHLEHYRGFEPVMASDLDST